MGRDVRASSRPKQELAGDAARGQVLSSNCQMRQGSRLRIPLPVCKPNDDRGLFANLDGAAKIQPVRKVVSGPQVCVWRGNQRSLVFRVVDMPPDTKFRRGGVR